MSYPSPYRVRTASRSSYRLLLLLVSAVLMSILHRTIQGARSSLTPAQKAAITAICTRYQQSPLAIPTTAPALSYTLSQLEQGKTIHTETLEALSAADLTLLNELSQISTSRQKVARSPWFNYAAPEVYAHARQLLMIK